MAGSHLAEEIGGEAFVRGAFLVGKGAFVGPTNQELVVDFGGLCLGPCINKKNQPT